MRFQKLIPIVVLGMVGAIIVHGTTLSIPNDFVAGTKIVAASMNANFTAIKGVVNGNIDSNNILDGSIASVDIADSAIITSKVNDLAITTAKINDLAVTTAKLANGAVTDTKLSISAIATASIATAAIVNSKIASGTITKDKMSGGSNSNALAACTDNAGSDVSCANIDLVPRGRPFLVMLLPSSVGGGITVATVAATTASGEVAIKINNATNARFSIGMTTNQNTNTLTVAPSSVWAIITPTAALNNTVNISVAVKSTSGSITITNCSLVVYEL